MVAFRSAAYCEVLVFISVDFLLLYTRFFLSNFSGVLLGYLSGLDWLRFFMCLFIAIFHFSVTTESQNLLFSLIASSGFYATSTFFILSGFILTFVYKAKLISGRLSRLDFIVKRLSSFYPLHMLLQLAFLLLLLSSVYILGVVPSSYTDIPSSEIFTYFIRSVFLIHAWEDQLLLNQPSWSLSALFFFYIVFVFSRKILMSSKYLFLLVVLWFFYLSPALINFYFPDSFITYATLHKNPLFRLPEFLCGMVAYNIFEKHADYVSKSYIYLGILGAVITAVVVFRNPEYKVLFHNGLVLPFQIILVLGCAKITRIEGNPKLFGSLALPIFMTHSLVLNITQFLFPNLNVFISLALNIALIILVSYISLKLISTPLQNKIRQRFLSSSSDKRIERK